MKIENLELYFSQLSSAWSKSKNNFYSDKRIEEYHKKLDDLYGYLDRIDFRLTKHSNDEISIIIDFFFKSIEFLDDSVQNLTPFEIIECLKHSIHDWVEDPQEYIIVTSLSNRMNDFKFDSSLIENEIPYRVIKKLFHIEFNYKLMQIILPKHLKKDYLSSVILFHELGHFVDKKYKIVAPLVSELFDKFWIITDPCHDDLIRYFPQMQGYCGGGDIDEDFKKFLKTVIESQFREYFCDLFASQYVGVTIKHYLEAVTYNEQRGLFRSHPSSILRIGLIEDFIESKKNIIIDNINDALQKIKERELRISYTETNIDNLIKLLPIELSEENISSVLLVGWKFWLMSNDTIEKENDFKFQLKPKLKYYIINSLIEKSIGNYIVISDWKILKENDTRQKRNLKAT